MFSNYKGLCSNYQMCEYLKLSTVYCEIAVQVANQNKVVKLKKKESGTINSLLEIVIIQL